MVYAKEAKRKLLLAKELSQTTYVYGATGYGKTTLVQGILNQSIDYYIDLNEESIPYEKLCEKKEQLVTVVLDNLQFLRNPEKKNQVLKLAQMEHIWLVLIGRAYTPKWIRTLYVQGQLLIIDERDLMLSHIETWQTMHELGLDVSKEEALAISKDTVGNILAIRIASRNIEKGLPVNELFFRKNLEEFFDYVEHHVLRQWDTELMEFMLKLCVVDEFTIEMAKEITGDNQTLYMLDRVLESGNYVIQKDDVYQIRPQFIPVLRRCSEKIFGQDRMKRYMILAGRYYEMQDDLLKALELYEKADAKESIRSLLIRNGRRTPGSGYFYELRHYYTNLQEEEVRSNVILMAAMSMIYSILLDMEKSEYWFEQLLAFSKTAEGGEKREAEKYILYLRIALPQRGIVDIVDILKSLPKLLMEKNLQLPEFSVTNNQPSTMNGGKDFCEWSKKDVLLANSIGFILDTMLGRFGKGLTHVAVGESFYEKGLDNYEVLNHLSRAKMESDNSGKLEIQFASVGIQIRLNIISGHMEDAISLYESFEKKLIHENAYQILENAKALRCKMALYESNIDYVESWLTHSPDESQEFCTLLRYQYVTKLRVYLQTKQYIKALSLIEKLQYYAEMNHRTYIYMETELIRCIILYRNNQDWKDKLFTLLDQMEGYHFVRIITEEGAAIYPLLSEIVKEGSYEKLNTPWFSQVMKEVKFMKQQYPSYAGAAMYDRADFKPIELDILRLQANGLTVKAIAKELDISERMTKYHAAENYRKLGVKGKTDAVVEAKKRKLL